MAKKILFNTISAGKLNIISSYHVSYQTLLDLKADFQSDKKELTTEKSALLAKREEAIKSLDSSADDYEALRDSIIAKYDIAPIERKVSALTEAYKEATQPHKKTMRECLDIIDDEVYYSYLLTMKTGNLSAKGTLEVRNGRKTEKIKVENTFTQTVKDFLDYLEVGNTENEKALSKMVDYLKLGVLGRKKARGKDIENGDYMVFKSPSEFKEDFMLCILQYCCKDHSIFKIEDDYTLRLFTEEDFED